MDEIELKEYRKRIKQPPSVPFLWEEKPGFPKKDWKPQMALVTTSPVPALPVKLVASIPFEWEEKPGTPLLSFPSPSLPHRNPGDLPFSEPDHFEDVNIGVKEGGDHSKNNGFDEMDVEAFSFETDEFFSSAPSLHPNCEISSPNISTVPTIPVKLVASVPFLWEEEPGKPLPFFPSLMLPQTNSINLPHTSSNSNGYYYDEATASSDSGAHNENNGTKGLDFETFGFETEESFSSIIVPVQTRPSIGKSSPHVESSSSPDSDLDSSTNSYATGTSSPTGASFLEWLFPLNPPKSSFMGKVSPSSRVHSAQEDSKGNDYKFRSNSSIVVRKPTTLGELILTSRRKSYRRKAVNMKQRNLSMQESMKRSAIGSCILELVPKCLQV